MCHSGLTHDGFDPAAKAGWAEHASDFSESCMREIAGRPTIGLFGRLGRPLITGVMPVGLVSRLSRCRP